ncbi:MAG: DDE-type integrase/transposase/recombinase [Lentisphaerae bacterium]|nr:DDE-type integrase/transposase/recombinase [Lentisphaerota bacterium]
MKRVSVYVKLRVIGAIDSMVGNSIVSRIREVSQLTFNDEDGVPHVFTWRTIQTWLSIYKQGGAERLKNRPRSDKGKHRKVSPEHLREAIERVLPEFRDTRYNKMMIYRRCIERGVLSQGECSQTSFFRLIREYDLLTPVSQTENKRRLAFSKQYANEMWQMDTMFGPYVKNGKTSTQAKLIAFIDDASRVVPHGQFFFSENTDNLITALRSGLYKRGIPQTLYVDNGAIYTSAEINQICVRIGTLLCHTPVRDGAAKGKIERFFRTCRDQFLLRQLDLSSLEALNDQFRLWVEDEYNTWEHGTLQMKPIDRFGMDLERIRFLDPMEANDELFFFEQDRSVRKDNTFQVCNVRYEAPRDLSGRKIQVRFNRANPKRIVVFYHGERMGEAAKLDFLSNDRAPRAASSAPRANKQGG